MQQPITILVFRSSGRVLAAPIANVREVVPAYELLRVSGMPPVLAGMMGLRGEVLPVIDTAALVGEEPLALDARQKFLVIRTDHRNYALQIEAVEDLVEIDAAQLVHPMPGARVLPLLGIAAIGEEMVLVLDVEACADLEPVLRYDDVQPVAAGEGVTP